MGLEQDLSKSDRGSEPDLSDEGLAELMDEMQQEDNATSEEGDGESGQSKDSDTEETSKEKGEQGKEEEGNEVEDAATADGIESIEDAVEMHRKDQQYINELQQERAELKKMMKPFVSKDEKGDYKIDKDRLSKQVAEDAGPSVDQKKKAIDMFWKDFDNDPLQAIGKVVATMNEGMMKPYEKDRKRRKRTQMVNRLHEEEYSKYGDLRDAVEDTLEKNDVLAKMGEEGVNLAYKSVIGDAMPSIMKKMSKKNGNKQKGKKKSGSTAPAGRSTGKDTSGEKSEEEKIREAIFQSNESDNYFK